jgi:acyl-CoA thioester hydrolase
VIEASPIALFTCRVEPQWVDNNGHMNVAYYAQVFDQALEGFFDLVNLGQHHRETFGAAMFVVENHFTYQSELRMGEEISIRLQLLDRDRKRIHCFMELIKAGESNPSATSEQIAVYVDLKTRKSLSIPTAPMATLSAYLEAHRRIARPKEVGHKIGIRRRRNPAFSIAG